MSRQADKWQTDAQVEQDPVYQAEARAIGRRYKAGKIQLADIGRCLGKAYGASVKRARVKQMHDGMKAVYAMGWSPLHGFPKEGVRA